MSHIGRKAASIFARSWPFRYSGDHGDPWRGGVWAWEISPIPTLLIVTSIVHGMGVALVLSWLITRLKTRNPLALSVIGFACGLLSAVLVHFVHHLVVLNEISRVQREHLVADPKIPQEEKGKILALFDANPLAPADEAIAETTGHHGFLGTMIFRNENGITIKRAKVSGWFLWGVWIVEGLIVAILPRWRAGQWPRDRFAKSVACGAKRIRSSAFPAHRRLHWSRPFATICRVPFPP